jgi:hypothetical protein
MNFQKHNTKAKRIIVYEIFFRSLYVDLFTWEMVSFWALNLEEQDNFLAWIMLESNKC